MSEVTEATQQAIDYSQRIPNNVNLANDRGLQRALEQWQPAFLDWWKGTGPVDASTLQVYLRTAVSVDKGTVGEYCNRSGARTHIDKCYAHFRFVIDERRQAGRIGRGDHGLDVEVAALDR